MRLIGGFLHLDGQAADPARLDAMAAAMTAPGLRPRIERWIDGPVALLVLDFGPPATHSAGNPPQHEAGLILAADLRLDEPDTALGQAGLAALLQAQGVAGLGRLAGDFAFAAWNPQRQTLLCARDGFGVRPLFFADRPGAFFAFASLPRGLHATGLVARQVEPAFLVDEFLLLPSEPERSLFKGVERLAPGGWLELGLDLGKPARRGWHWRPDPARAGTCRIGAAEAAAELSRLVQAAVQRRLPGAGPVAAHLSGGLDSSAIAILAARALQPAGRDLLAYSAVPAAFGAYRFGGDGPYIAPVLRQQPGITWQAVRVEKPADFVLPAMDQDQILPVDQSFGEGRILADAAAAGAQMLLSGWGGDEGCSFSRRGVLAEALLTGRWGYLATELRALGSAQAAWGDLAPHLLPDTVQALIRRLAGRPPIPPGLAEISADLLLNQHVAGRSLRRPALPATAKGIRLALISGPGLPRRAEQWSLLAARHGMAVSFPLLDRQLVEFALSLPSALFVRQGWSRRVFRDAMADVLPEALRWKPGKADLVVEGPVYVAAERHLLADRLAALRQHQPVAGFFNLDAMAAWLQALPPAERLAQTIDSGQGDWPAIEKAGGLLRAFRIIAYLEQHG